MRSYHVDSPQAAARIVALTVVADGDIGVAEIECHTATVWADCVKGISLVDGRFVYTINLQFPECQPFGSRDGQARMIDFVRRNWTNCNPTPTAERCHKQYHYTDVAIQRDAYASNLASTSDHDMVAATNAAIAVLRASRHLRPSTSTAAARTRSDFSRNRRRCAWWWRSLRSLPVRRCRRHGCQPSTSSTRPYRPAPHPRNGRRHGKVYTP